jgi:hypothetical protein
MIESGLGGFAVGTGRIAVGIAMPSPDGGFSVDVGALERAAGEAKGLGGTFSALHSALESALVAAEPVGLGLGIALRSVAPQWDALLSYLAAQVDAAGTSLSANVTAYTATDAQLSSVISGIGG